MKSTSRIDFVAFKKRSGSSVTLQFLRGNEDSIRGELANLPRTLNGPQRNVASKTVASVEMLKGGLEKLQYVLELHGYTVHLIY